MIMNTLETLIPTERLDAVHNALDRVFKTPSVQHISRLPGGLSTAKVYKLIVGEKSFLLKLDTPKENAAERDSALTVAAEAGIAPSVLYINDADAITITRFIEGKPHQQFFKSPEEHLSKLAEVIRGIHELPLFKKEDNLEVTVDQLILQFKHSKMLIGPIFNECYAYYDLIKKHYPFSDKDRVSSHNDLNPSNIIYDHHRIWIVDWDAAFANDRYVDLAIAANFNVNNEKEELVFLKAYFGEDLNEYQRARFFIMRQICYIVYAILMFRLANHSKPDKGLHDAEMQNVTLEAVKRQLGSGEINLSAYDGQLLFGKGLFKEVVINMRSPRFPASIKLL